ncbi:MAG: DUF3307 domain-containing protein [Bdellovibrio sp.]|nr:DUF3307 domain-containing protein [Methylotenera sp.]
MLIALFALFVKHFICDFPLQIWPWMYRNKSTYLHPGGIAHAAIHGAGTFGVLIFFDITFACLAGLFDMLVHYHIDWAKMNMNARYHLKPDNSEWFWIAMGFDQLLHHATYFIIVYYAFIYYHST